jgi:hypothetical protein
VYILTSYIMRAFLFLLLWLGSRLFESRFGSLPGSGSRILMTEIKQKNIGVCLKKKFATYIISSQASVKDLQSSRRSLQLFREKIQLFKAWVFWGSFLCSLFRIRIPTDPFESGFNPDPKHCLAQSAECFFLELCMDVCLCCFIAC